MNLSELFKLFADENAAREYLEKLRWPNGTICPHCAVIGEATKLNSRPGSTTRPGVWKCRACRGQFTVTVGSVMEDSHIPLSKWAIAFHLLCASKKGMSAHQLHRMLGIKYESAWFMAHRIRYAMEPSAQPDKLRGIVEVDETYIGGKASNKLKKMGKGRGTVGKIPVVSLIQRGGKVQSMVMPRVTAKNIRKVLRARVSPIAKIMTDDLAVYDGLEHSFAGARERQALNQGVRARRGPRQHRRGVLRHPQARRDGHIPPLELPASPPLPERIRFPLQRPNDDRREAGRNRHQDERRQAAHHGAIKRARQLVPARRAVQLRFAW